MRISDWSSDVCSSDLQVIASVAARDRQAGEDVAADAAQVARQQLADVLAQHVHCRPVIDLHHHAARALGLGDQVRPADRRAALGQGADHRSEEHTSELQSLMRISYAVFCLKKKKINYT